MELKPSRLGGLLQVFAQKSRVFFPVAVAVLLLPGPALRWTSPRITSSAFCHETLWSDLPRFHWFCPRKPGRWSVPIPFVWLLQKRGKTLGSIFEVVKTHPYVYIYFYMLCVFLLTKKQTPPPNFGWHVSYSHCCRLVSFCEAAQGSLFRPRRFFRPVWYLWHGMWVCIPWRYII